MNPWLTMLLAGLLTYGIRLSFIALLGRITVPDWFRRALRFVPAAVLSAIIVPGLFDRGGTMDFSARNPQLWAGILAVAVAWRTKSVLLTIAGGMVALLALQLILG
ncbi:MAG TPA: AzlD domain-containing protein [Spirochaetia bacterium]|nr:AzlD domain-containing protein [Spirochaetia bacterium]